MKRKGRISSSKTSGTSRASSSTGSSGRKLGMKNRGTAILLCFFLGAFGAHKFYLGQAWLGVVYILFVWTLIPGLIASIEFIILVVMSDEEFRHKF